MIKYARFRFYFKGYANQKPMLGANPNRNNFYQKQKGSGSMCEFCENEKNLSVADGIIKIEKNHYSPSGYCLVADNSGNEYGKASCPIWHCPMCGRKLSEVSGNDCE